MTRVQATDRMNLCAHARSDCLQCAWSEALSLVPKGRQIHTYHGPDRFEFHIRPNTLGEYGIYGGGDTLIEAVRDLIKSLRGEQ